MKRKLALLFLIVVVIPMFMAIYTTSRLVTSYLTDMLQKRARDSLAVAHNYFLNTLDEMALKVQILSQSKDIREAVRSNVAFVCNDLAKEPAASLAAEPAWVQTGKNLLALPLSGDKGILGVLYLVDHPQGFVDDDVELLSDISIQIAIAIQKAQLHQLAITDGLTGLYIHRYFQLRLDAAIAKAKRREEPVSLILFDVDHFKKFNDTWGHQIGDRVLKKVAEITAATVREGIDLPARYGGEEFTVIMPNTPLEGALHLAERIRTNVEQTILMHEDKPISVTISLGCATFPDHAADKETLIKTADEALYRSKQAGRNCTTPA